MEANVKIFCEVCRFFHLFFDLLAYSLIFITFTAAFDWSELGFTVNNRILRYNFYYVFSDKGVAVSRLLSTRVDNFPRSLMNINDDFI